MVDFELSEDQRLLRETASAFASEVVRPAARDADEARAIPKAVVDRSWELGLVQSAVPEAYGGFGAEASAVTAAIVLEELGFGDLSIAIHVLAPKLLIEPVAAHGTEAQKSRWLPPLAGPSFHPATAAIVEPRLRFDPTALETTHRQASGGFVLEGRKAFVPLAGEASSILVYSRAADYEPRGDPASDAHAVDAFVIESDSPNTRIGAREDNMGLRALDTREIELNGVTVPAEARVGGDRGIDFGRIANRSRVGLAALAVGVARAAYEYARDYAKERRAFGAAIAQKQAIAFLLAEMAIEIDATRLLVWQAAWKLDRGEDATREAWLAKTHAGEIALRVADNAVQILGGHGYVRDHMVELYLRNARAFALLEGLAIA